MSESMRYEDASDRIFTVANAMTALRPMLALGSVWALHKGNYKWAAGLAAGAAISDKEGTVGRAIEKRKPGWGITKLGIKGDPVADSAAVGIFGLGALLNKRVHPIAKAGLGLVMGQEIKKIKWAYDTTKDYQERTGAKDTPVIPVTETGKRATFSKLSACVGAIATAILNEGSITREVIAYGTLGSGVLGAVLGEEALGELKEEYAKMVEAFNPVTPITTMSAE